MSICNEYFSTGNHAVVELFGGKIGITCEMRGSKIGWGLEMVRIRVLLDELDCLHVWFCLSIAGRHDFLWWHLMLVLLLAATCYHSKMKVFDLIATVFNSVYQ